MEKKPRTTDYTWILCFSIAAIVVGGASFDWRWVLGGVIGFVGCVKLAQQEAPRE
jgi:hypothetical protein